MSRSNLCKLLVKQYGRNSLFGSSLARTRPIWLKMTNERKVTANGMMVVNLSTSSDGKNSAFSIQANQDGGQEATAEMKNTYERVANETLESLTEKFDLLADELGSVIPDDYDSTFSNGVLTVNLGANKGTYVINKQTPNLQIWLSSPVSGPKRFDLINNTWIYKRTGETLHQLLSVEISKSYAKNIDFTKCSFGS